MLTSGETELVLKQTLKPDIEPQRPSSSLPLCTARRVGGGDKSEGGDIHREVGSHRGVTSMGVMRQLGGGKLEGVTSKGATSMGGGGDTSVGGAWWGGATHQ